MIDNVQGPWAEQFDCPEIHDSNGELVATVYPARDAATADSDGLADRMALIGAAPELLAALERADSLLSDLRAHELDDPKDIETLDMIAKAIAKATSQAVQS